MTESQYDAATPDSTRYSAAFLSVRPLSDGYLAMLRYQYHAPNRIATATEMARAAGFDHHGVANPHYGRLGRQIGDMVNFLPSEMAIDVLVTQSKPAGEFAGSVFGR